MSAMKNNRLLLGTLAFNVLWFAGGPLVPNTYLSGMVSFLLIAGGVGLVAFYRQGFVDVLFRQRRDAVEPGSHISLFSAFIAGFGAVASGVFNIMWVRAGSPVEWTGTVFSNYGRVVMALAFFGLAVGPHVGRSPASWPRQSTLVAASIVAVILAYIVGTQTQPTEPTVWPASVWYGADRPVCAPGRPVWGVTASRIYHTERSRYRNLVVPDRCFHNEWEARAAGYRPPAD